MTGILTRGEEAIIHVQENKPDIVLMDIHLKGYLDGIETVALIHQHADIPLFISPPILMKYLQQSEVYKTLCLYCKAV